MGALLRHQLLCICCGLLLVGASACSKDKDTEPAQATAKTKASQPKIPKDSVSTPPLELASTTEATGTERATGTAPTLPSVPFQPTEVKSQTNIIVLLDASGSMNGPIDSATKMSYARSTIKDLLVQPAPGLMKRQFGISTFGAQVDVAENDCKDVRELGPLGTTSTDLGAALESVEPKGTSPIAFALQQAANNLPEAGPGADNMIILLADGGDNCNADPCQAAEQIHHGPSKAMVHVIGFDLDQEAEAQLRCVAEKSDGRFFLARNVPELRNAADQAVSANLPYNLRVKVFAGSTPLATQMTVYQAGTRTIVNEGHSTGTKFYQLAPGTYDILITYAESVEDPKPSKMLKQVEVQATARAEQIVEFELGTMQLAGEDPKGNPVALQYTLQEAGSTTPLGTITGDIAPRQIAVTPGTYTITADGPTMEGIPLRTTIEQIRIAKGETTTQLFRFQIGEFFLRGETSLGDFVPFHFSIAATDAPDKPLKEGEVTTEGVGMTLPIGTYQLTMQPSSPLLQGSSPLTVEALEIVSHEEIQRLVTFPVGQLQLVGRDGAGVITKTEFKIAVEGEAKALTQQVAKDAPIAVVLGPRQYQVMATNIGGAVSPPPTVEWHDIVIASDATESKEAVFQLGTLSATATDANGHPIAGEFTVFRTGQRDHPLIAQKTPLGDFSVRLTPGLYDLEVQDTSADSLVIPRIWKNRIAVVANTVSNHLMAFTAGRVRITCRGTNDSPRRCNFRIFTYGQDAPIFAAETKKAWKEFEMAPGNYYVEVASFDKDKDHELKKWINVTIKENDLVEKLVRF